MTEVKVTKDPKAEYTGMSPWFGFEAPLIRRGFLVTAELPGVSYEDVKVYFTGDALVLEGERKCYFHTERSYGRFYRAIPVPEGANAEKATAQFNNGVLKVVIPIPEIVSKMREIPVTEGAPSKVETTH
jgi:HSP20 family protein